MSIESPSRSDRGGLPGLDHITDAATDCSWMLLGLRSDGTYAGGIDDESGEAESSVNFAVFACEASLHTCLCRRCMLQFGADICVHVCKHDHTHNIRVLYFMPTRTRTHA